MHPKNERRKSPATPAPCEDEARLALLQAAYLQAGLTFTHARLAALADYRCGFVRIGQLAA